MEDNLAQSWVCVSLNVHKECLSSFSTIYSGVSKLDIDSSDFLYDIIMPCPQLYRAYDFMEVKRARNSMACLEAVDWQH